ncbi:MAG: M28 family peptidase, partial [Planctomycetota bacterium]
AQQALLREHFESLGATVQLQRFKGPDPRARGRRVRMANLVARWRSDATRRVLLCAHYDTRPLPDRDPDPAARRNGVFIGANDGGSGVAVLMELAHLMPSAFGDESETKSDDPLGVDFALFDAEEFVYSDRDPYFLGSQWFGQRYKRREPLPPVEPAREPRPWRYDAAVLLDMVGDADLQLYFEGYSFARRDTRAIAREVWDVAERLGVREFVPGVRHRVEDDHVALRRYGGIAAIDVIDFDYPHWHTTRDTPERCSGESLAKVGWVVWEWLLQRAAAPTDAT